MPDSPPRNYPRLFTAMNAVLGALASGGDAEEALRLSFREATEGFSAEKALLLQVDSERPTRLRRVSYQGLSEAQVAACERGESVRGVSASIIRIVLESRQPRLVQNPYLEPDLDNTPALPGQNYSVLCAPILDAIRGVVVAVLYFQNEGGSEFTYQASDLEWLEGYASAVGLAFGYYFQEQRREQELQALLESRTRPANGPDLIGDSAHTRALRRQLHEVYIPASEAPDPDPVLIHGEKGTGKDLVARYLYAYSARRSHPFIAVNCAEISDELAAARFFGHKRGSFTGAVGDELGFFRSANGGVLFLDEVAELSPRAQGTLLRVLENRTVVPVGETKEIRVDVQVVVATNRDLDKAAAEGSIKPDFLDRLRTQALLVLPLRDRPWDIPALVQYYIAHHENRTRKKTLGLTPEALRLLISYSWPGNVREVARVCSSLVIHAKPGAHLDRSLLEQCYLEAVTAQPNPKVGPVLWDDAPMRDAVRTFQRELILSRLERYRWDFRATRESLKLPKTTLRRYALRLGIQAPESATDDS